MADPVERLADTLKGAGPLDNDQDARELADLLHEDGVGFEEDHLRGFAEWAQGHLGPNGSLVWDFPTSHTVMPMPKAVDRYLASRGQPKVKKGNHNA